MLKCLRSTNWIYLVDYSGLFVSSLCFIHCWAFPVLLIVLPGSLIGHEWVHPVLCVIAIISTVPMIVRTPFIWEMVIFYLAVGFGNVLMLLIIFGHDHLGASVELLLNTMGGVSLVYAHCMDLKMKWRKTT